MSKAGAPVGNQNAKRGRMFREQLLMELKDAHGRYDLRKIAKNLIRMAESDGPEALAAIKELADRVEGKSVSSVELTGDEGEAISLTVVFRDALKDDNGND